MFGADDKAHPAVRYLHDHAGSVYLGGPVAGHRAADALRLQASARHARRSCAHRFRKLGWRRVVAFQTRNPMHRAHQELTFRAAQEAEANLLIHPVVGMTKPGDVDHYTRVRCYETLLGHYPEQTTTLSAPAARDAHGRPARGGLARDHPQELRLHPPDRRPRPRRPGQRQRRASRSTAPTTPRSCSRKHQDELGIAMVPFQQTGLRRRTARSTCREDEVEPGETVLSTSPAPSCAAACRKGCEIPDWFTFPEVVEELRRTHPPRAPAGLHRLLHRPLRLGQVDHRQRAAGQAAGAGRPPGDAARRRPGAQAPVVRARLLARSTATSTSCASATSRREITKNGGIAICAPIAPYDATRAKVREHDRARRRLPRDPRRDLARGLRGAATARASTPRRAPASSRSSPASPTPTRRRRTRRCGSTRRS